MRGKEERQEEGEGGETRGGARGKERQEEERGGRRRDKRRG